MRPTTGLPRWIATIAVGLCLPGCATVGSPAPRDPVSIDRPDAPAAPTPDAPADVPAEALPPEVGEALLPPIHGSLPGEPALGDPVVGEPRFDLAVRDAPAPEFFMNLVQDTQYDMVVHPAVEGKISLTLKDATIPEILDAVRQVYGYDFRSTPKGFFVRPARLQSRSFQVNYPHLQRTGHSQTRVSSGQLSEQFSESGERSQSGTAATTGGDRRQLIESSQVETSSEMDLWQELASSLRAIVGTQEGRVVVISPQAGIVTVRGMPAELRQAEAFLNRAQANLRRQVILEAKILEVELADAFRAGINWSGLIDWGGKSILGAQTGGATLLGNAAASDIAGNTGFLDPDILSPVSNTDTSAFGGLFSLALDLNDFTAFIELLETQGDVRVLSSPRISTVNNQKAVIKVGSDEFFVTDVSSTTVTTASAPVTTPQIELTPFFSGIALDVMPQIDESGEVVLHVHPSVSEVVDQTKVVEVGGETQTLPLAFSTIRESDSIVRARSGQVIVIGGLMQDLTTDRRAAFPLLGKIPYLGLLFRQTREISNKSELVILLRPTVVGEGTWTREIRNVAKRFEESGYGLETELLAGEEERGAP